MLRLRDVAIARSNVQNQMPGAREGGEDPSFQQRREERGREDEDPHPPHPTGSLALPLYSSIPL